MRGQLLKARKRTKVLKFDDASVVDKRGVKEATDVKGKTRISH